jgi:hypothetical protein
MSEMNWKPIKGNEFNIPFDEVLLFDGATVEIGKLVNAVKSEDRVFANFNTNTMNDKFKPTMYCFIEVPTLKEVLDKSNFK